MMAKPFHSFAELVSAADQRRALSATYEHLAETGRFICTLHNPPVRLKSVDGRLRLRGKYPLEKGRGTLLLWGVENYDPKEGVVQGSQFFEAYNVDGVMQSKRWVEIQFRLLGKEAFEALAESTGFKVVGLHGDYAYSAFQEETSPFMVWTLGK